MLINVSIEDESRIVASALKDSIESLEQSIQERKDGTGVAFFKQDKEKDIKEMKKYLKAMNKTLDFF